MTRVAIIAAMAGELKPLVRGWTHERRGAVGVWRRKFDEGEWVAACSGAGVGAAGRAFAEVEKSGAADILISFGWAGALTGELESGSAYWASQVIDARTGERFEVSADRPTHRDEAATRRVPDGAMAEDEKQKQILRLGRRGDLPQDGNRIEIAQDGSNDPTHRDEAAMNGAQTGDQGHPPISLVTSPRVADEVEKKRLAAAYGAQMVDMEAAAIARLAQMRGIPFYVLKGISDGFTDKLPDFNRFIRQDGRFNMAGMALFSILRPWHWSSLIRMGENSSKASQSMREAVLDFLDERAYTRDRNGYPNLKHRKHD